LPTAVSAQKKEFIGYRHRGVVHGERLPNGARDLGGGLLSDENYGVSRFVKGRKQMLWLEKITSRDKKGIPSWEVKDVLVISNPKKNQEFLFSYGSTCTENGAEDLDLIVLAEFQAAQKSYKVLQAWRADLLREKFQPLSVETIKCEYVEP
ncbi:MAG: hypothetical protein M3384_20940, partial [Acidobacteriota bacterium]|nr:hypothetical protein [Acidobacteriota bacterium]